MSLPPDGRPPAHGDSEGGPRHDMQYFCNCGNTIENCGEIESVGAEIGVTPGKPVALGRGAGWRSELKRHLVLR